jgi:hypothetical protein
MGDVSMIRRGGKCPAVGTWWVDVEGDLLTIIGPDQWSWHESDTAQPWSTGGKGGNGFGWPLAAAPAPADALPGLVVVPPCAEPSTLPKGGLSIADRFTPLDDPPQPREGATYTLMTATETRNDPVVGPLDPIRLLQGGEDIGALSTVLAAYIRSTDDGPEAEGIADYLDTIAAQHERNNLPLEQVAWMTYTSSPADGWARVPSAAKAEWVHLVTTIVGHPAAAGWL